TAEAKSRRALSALAGSSRVRKRRKTLVSTKTLRIELLGPRSAPRRRNLATDAAEVLGPVFRLHGALDIEDGAMNRLQDDLFSSQMEGDPVSEVQPQLIAQGLGNGDLAFTGEG